VPSVAVANIRVGFHHYDYEYYNMYVELRLRNATAIQQFGSLKLNLNQQIVMFCAKKQLLCTFSACLGNIRIKSSHPGRLQSSATFRLLNCNYKAQKYRSLCTRSVSVSRHYFRYVSVHEATVFIMKHESRAGYWGESQRERDR
jgi:hypothetical protein